MTPRARSILVDGYGLASRWCLAASRVLRRWAEAMYQRRQAAWMALPASEVARRSRRWEKREKRRRGAARRGYFG